MKGRTGFALGAITALLAASAAAVALNRHGKNVVDELDSRIPNPLFKKTEVKAETSVDEKTAADNK